MKVIGDLQKDPWKSGFWLRGGDVVYPWGGNWLARPYHTNYIHFFCRWKILPFLSVKIGRFGFYVGFKCFGVDREEYREWFRAEDVPEVYDGSNALAPSVRWSNSR